MIDPAVIAADVAAALAEDIGAGDLFAAINPSSDRVTSAALTTREEGVFCGQPWFEQSFRQLDSAASFRWMVRDGEAFAGSAKTPARLCEISVKSGALLSAERVALNFIQTLSATATAAARLKQRLVDFPKVVVLDTRKTLPKLRHAQKYAAGVGGATNHRMGLYDSLLIKENHILAGGGIDKLTRLAVARFGKDTVQVEVENIDELARGVAAGARCVLLDNFPIEAIAAAVNRYGNDVCLEASGNITEENIVAIARTGVHRISVGGITKNIRAVDFSLRVEN